MQTVRVPGSRAIAELDRLRGEYGTTGLYPILFGDDDDYSRMRERAEICPKELATPESNGTIDPIKWFADKKKNEPEHYHEPIGEWPTTEADKMGITSHLGTLSGEPKKEVVIGLLEISAPYEAFISLNWGGWNDCPFSAEHSAIHKYWQGNWGAKVVCVTPDVVECIVSRPPRDRKAALQLAIQQYIYCYDIVEQGTQTIAALAAQLIDSPAWYFWWD